MQSFNAEFAKEEQQMYTDIPSTPIPETRISKLMEQYEVLLLDAYGVLVTHCGTIPGAVELIRKFNEAKKPYYVITNDASRSPETSSQRYERMGLSIQPERIITSGLLLKRYFEEKSLQGSKCVVLGTEDSAEYVRAAGGKVVNILDQPDPEAEILVVCDEHGYPLLETLDATLTFLYHRLDGGNKVHLLLPNPDIIYPAGEVRYGFTAGALAGMLEIALRFRYPQMANELKFVPMGKPYGPIFEEAYRRSETKDMVMVGDQLRTDIKGAIDFGIASALVATGLTPMEDAVKNREIRPTYLLKNLELDQ